MKPFDATLAERLRKPKLSHIPITLGIIVICIAVYLLQHFWNEQVVFLSLVINPFVEPHLSAISDGEWWRLFSPMLLHFSIFHIVFNMMWIWDFGKIIEVRQGGWVFILICLVCSVCANLIQFWVSGPSFGGMSGVVYGLFGYLWIQGQFNPAFGIKLNPTIVKLLLGFFVICWTGLLEKFFSISVANAAHSAGLVSGIVIAFILVFLARRRL